MDGIRIATLVTLAANTVAVILLSTFLITSAQEQRETSQCYQGVVDQLSDYLTKSRQAAAQDRQSQRELLLSMVGGEPNPAALDRYLRQLDEADRTRSENLPPVPRCAG